MIKKIYLIIFLLSFSFSNVSANQISIELFTINNLWVLISTIKYDDQGRGKIFIVPIEECIRIRSGEKWKDAIG